MYKLRTDLEGALIWKLGPDGSFHTDCPDVAQAQGVVFVCPLCLHNNKGARPGVHSVICWFNGRGVPAGLDPGPGRWNPAGSSLDDLTFVPPGAISVLLTGEGCKWHGYVRNGEATLS